MGNKQPKLSKEHENYTREMRLVHDNVIGDGVIFNGPFGKRAVVYCDYTASGRPLQCIEEYITKYVLPYYANTHTTTSITAQQTTAYRNDAKKMIKKCVNATSDDVVIFTGSGTTGAINKLIAAMELKEKSKNLVVFVSPFEHHSNLLPWKETGAEVMIMKEAASGILDYDYLKRKLEEGKRAGKMMIASFSAASNITGIMTDTDLVSELCHRYGCLTFWDYATAAPYLNINMNKTENTYKDALFCSPHKFVGGPGTPGILIAKKRLFTNAVPTNPGGGTVLYVFDGKHKYLDDIESREEGGTPAIVESIRAGLVFKLKQDIGPDMIEQREEYLYKKARKAWRTSSNVVLLGGGHVKRLPIFSFLVKYRDSGKFLHHNFIATLLNDLFGIQARGGCACAGPYGERLLGIKGKDFAIVLDPDFTNEKPGVTIGETKQSESGTLVEGCESHQYSDSECTFCQSKGHKPQTLECMKPGFVRINLPFFMLEAEIQYIIDAVDMISSEGWKLLPMYKLDPKSGEWSHRDHQSDIMGLSDVVFADEMKLPKHPKKFKLQKMDAKFFQESLDIAQEIFDNARQMVSTVDTTCDDDVRNYLPADKHDLVWFVDPKQAAVDVMLVGTKISSETSPAWNKHTVFFPRQMSTFGGRKSRNASFLHSHKLRNTRMSIKIPQPVIEQDEPSGSESSPSECGEIIVEQLRTESRRNSKVESRPNSIDFNKHIGVNTTGETEKLWKSLNQMEMKSNGHTETNEHSIL